MSLPGTDESTPNSLNGETFTLYQIRILQEPERAFIQNPHSIRSCASPFSILTVCQGLTRSSEIEGKRRQDKL